MKGNDSVDFLHRISTQSFAHFNPGEIRRTLLITEKGKMIDTIWVIHQTDRLLLLVSKGKAVEICDWLGRFIIMEDIELENISDQYSVTLNFSNVHSPVDYLSDYFSIPVTFSLQSAHSSEVSEVPHEFECWRIWNGIPVANKEIIREYNPLELRLKEWISFTKGCYIGQEVIARLDTYQKVQRTLFRCMTDFKISENDDLFNSNGEHIGKCTSVIECHECWIALVMLKTKSPHGTVSVFSKQSTIPIICEPPMNSILNGKH